MNTAGINDAENSISLSNQRESLNLEREFKKEISSANELLRDRFNITKDVQKVLTDQTTKIAEQSLKSKSLYEEIKQQYIALRKAGDSAQGDQIRRLIQSSKDQLALIRMEFDEAKNIIAEQNDKLKRQKEIHTFISSSLKERLGVELKELTNFGAMSDKLGQLFPKMDLFTKSVIAALATLMLFARQMYDAFEKSAWKFREFTGLMRGQAVELRNMAEDITINFTHLGVSLDGIYESIKVLGVEMGGFRNATEDVVKTTSLLKAQLGVSEENTAGMLRNMAFVANSTMQSQQSMAYFAGSLAQAAGVPLNVVMGDVAKMSGTAFAMVSKTPLAIIKTAVEARKLNTTLNDIAKASESILDFQNSVNAEMEASVLIGNSINLQRARELAYRGKLVESTQEILRIAKQVNFENLDVFQMQAFAKATGRSVEELTKMLQAERQMEEARRDPNLAKQVAEYERLRAANEATAKNSAKNLELMIMQKANQERMVALQNKWNELWMKASKILLPIVDLSMLLIGVFLDLFPIVTSIGGILIYISTIMFGIGDSIAVINRTTNLWLINANKVLALGRALSGDFSLVTGKIANIGALIGKWLGPLSGVGLSFLKILGPIGWVITAFQFLSSLFTNWKKNMAGGDNFFVAGIKAGITALYDVIVKPFKDAWNWIMDFFGGKSKSKLSNRIIVGLVAAGAEIFDALTSPWRAFLAWIADKIPGMGKVSSYLRGGLSGALSLEKNANEENLPAAGIKPNTTVVPIKTNDITAIGEQQIQIQEQSNKSLDAILVAINTLNANLVNGRIAVKMDGSLVSTTMAKNQEFKGAYGMNVA